MTDGARLVRHEALQRFALAVLEGWDTPRTIAETTMELMIRTDLRGVDSHGIGMLPKDQLEKVAVATGIPFTVE